MNVINELRVIRELRRIRRHGLPVVNGPADGDRFRPDSEGCFCVLFWIPDTPAHLSQYPPDEDALGCYGLCGDERGPTHFIYYPEGVVADHEEAQASADA